MYLRPSSFIRNLFLLFVCFSLLLLSSCSRKQAKEVAPTEGEVTDIVRDDFYEQEEEIAGHAMVVSAREEASKVGIEILKKGGNAFDAMVGVELALAVTYPYAGNLGGGGFMVYRKNDGTTGALDYREKAPKAAHKDMYLDDEGNIIPGLSYTGALAVGVPGTVAGVCEVHKEMGSLPFSEIVAPVIFLAKQGYVVTEAQAERFAHYDQQFQEVNGHKIFYSKHFKAGNLIRNGYLAQTLTRIVKNGRKEFYGNGLTSKLMLRFLERHGGIITKEDLEDYECVWRKPVNFKYDDLTIYSMSPPSSGGIALGQIMKMIEPYDLSSYGHNSVKSIQVITEAERRAYADRSHYLGDPDFVSVPQGKLLNDGYLKGRMDDFSWDKATASSDVNYGSVTVIPESNETTHYSIVDTEGNAVAVTTTLNGAYGSKLYVDSLGFFLNNEMDDFSAKPGVPNAYGLVGAEANAIAPEKRMLSSMTPTIVEKDGNLYMVVGTPGGSTIITSVLQTILNVHEYGMDMQDAVNAPRFHHQWLPDEIMMEPQSFDPRIKDILEKKGYKINEENSPVIGKVDAIMVMPDGTLQGGADRRGDDAAVGF